MSIGGESQRSFLVVCFVDDVPPLDIASPFCPFIRISPFPRASPSGAEAELVCVAESVLTYAEIRERLNLPDEDVARLLHSLTMLKHKILLKEPDGRQILKTDSFRVNVAFNDRLRRIRVLHPFCSLSVNGCASARASVSG